MASGFRRALAHMAPGWFGTPELATEEYEAVKRQLAKEIEDLELDIKMLEMRENMAQRMMENALLDNNELKAKDRSKEICKLRRQRSNYELRLNETEQFLRVVSMDVKRVSNMERAERVAQARRMWTTEKRHLRYQRRLRHMAEGGQTAEIAEGMFNDVIGNDEDAARRGQRQLAEEYRGRIEEEESENKEIDIVAQRLLEETRERLQARRELEVGSVPTAPPIVRPARARSPGQSRASPVGPTAYWRKGGGGGAGGGGGPAEGTAPDEDDEEDDEGGDDEGGGGAALPAVPAPPARGAPVPLYVAQQEEALSKTRR